jgi:hypothetical protein
MGKPTFDNGVPRPCAVRHEVLGTRTRGLRIANAMLGFGSPLSSEGMRSLNKIGGFKQTQGTETSQYLEERTSTETPLVVASERGPGQWRMRDNRNRLESRALAGDSPVRVMQTFVLE